MKSLLRGTDFAFNFFILNDDDSEFDMDALNDLYAYALVNKREVGRYSLNVKAGYEAMVIGDEAHEVVIPIARVVNLDWPQGLLEFRIELVIDEEYFDPDGQNNPIILEAGMLK